jgi:hypothetical protein
MTSFTLPEECKTPEDCDKLLAICTKRRESAAKLAGYPRKGLKAWDAKILAIELRKDGLVAHAVDQKREVN